MVLQWMFAKGSTQEKKMLSMSFKDDLTIAWNCSEIQKHDDIRSMRAMGGLERTLVKYSPCEVRHSWSGSDRIWIARIHVSPNYYGVSHRGKYYPFFFHICSLFAFICIHFQAYLYWIFAATRWRSCSCNYTVQIRHFYVLYLHAFAQKSPIDQSVIAVQYSYGSSCKVITNSYA